MGCQSVFELVNMLFEVKVLLMGRLMDSRSLTG